MKVSARCKEMIKHHEGVRYKPYRCPARLWTVGVGHVLYPDQARLPLDQRDARLWTVGVGHVLYPDQGRLPLDQRDTYPLKAEDNRVFSGAEVDGILGADLRRFEVGVAKLFPVVLTQGQFDALVSFAFNLGLGGVQRSTLRQKVLRGEIEEASNEFLKFTRGGGKVLPGLVKRRQDERALFLS